MERRRFLTLSLSSLMAATFATNPVLAEALITQPPEDLIAGTARLSRKLNGIHDMLSKEQRRTMSNHMGAAVRSDPLITSYQDASVELMAHLLNPGFGMPTKLDMRMLFDCPEVWGFDALSEASLNSVALEVVPVATIRYFATRLGQPYAIPSPSLPIFGDFSARYVDVMLISKNEKDPETDRFVAAFRSARLKGNTDAMAEMSHRFMHHRETGSGLWLPKGMISA